jgi:hypothetical protein
MRTSTDARQGVSCRRRAAGGRAAAGRLKEVAGKCHPANRAMQRVQDARYEGLTRRVPATSRCGRSTVAALTLPLPGAAGRRHVCVACMAVPLSRVKERWVVDATVVRAVQLAVGLSILL